MREHLNGKLIVVEGPDGAGKTTLTAKLQQTLSVTFPRYSFVATQQPWADGVVGKLIRQLLQGEQKVSESMMALLFAADRADHFAKLVQPALADGKIVICDRYIQSSLIYQGKLKGLGEDWIMQLHRGFYYPADLLLVIDTPVVDAMRRNVGKKQERYDHIADRARVHELYEQLLPREGARHIDGNFSEEHVRTQAVKIISQAIQRWQDECPGF